MRARAIEDIDDIDRRYRNGAAIHSTMEEQAAYDRADAWARSADGTPYGVTEPVPKAPKSGAVPDPLDPRVMARLHGKEVDR